MMIPQNYLIHDANEELSSSPQEINSEEEEDLEIPAFLRRQKELMVFKKINECHHKSGKTFSSITK